jgi:predicted amidohydrolase
VRRRYEGLGMTRFLLAVAQSTAVPRDVRENVSRHVRFASAAADHGVRMIVFPELSLTGYDLHLTTSDALAPEDPRLQPLRDVSRAHEIVVVAGAPLACPGGLCIGAIAFAPGGGVDTYTKQYLHGGEDVAFRPGRGGDPLSIDDHLVGLAICADATHPEHAREAVRRGATVYAAGCLITEDGYTADTALLQRYATDHGMLVLMANYGAPVGGWSPAGKSAIWSDDGTLLACAPAAGEALVIAERVSDHWVGRVVLCPA